MDKFKLMYQILRFIELAADQDEFDADAFSEKHFGVTRNEFLNVIEMMIDAKYVKGIELRESVDWRVGLYITWPKLTLEGLRFLTTDEIMVKEAKDAKGFNVQSLLARKR